MRALLPLFVALLVPLACARPEPPPRPRSDSAVDIPQPSGSTSPEITAEAEASIDPELVDRLTLDGSSTVFPITEAIVEIFEATTPNVTIQLGVSGTGGGFEKFCRGQTDLSNASRPIKPTEARLCAEHGVRYVELPVAFDGLSIVVHGDNSWSHCLTTDELRELWHPDADGTITRWKQLRADFPDRPIHLYAPGRDSGTFDYFTHAIVGEEGSSRDDFVGSEDDYLLAQDIADDPHALGFFGYAYYREYSERLNAVAIDPGSGCVGPSLSAITSGSYRPLSRPLFVYAKAEALDRPAMGRFVDLYLRRAGRLATELGYVPLPAEIYELGRRRVAQRRTGSIFDGGSQIGLSIGVLLGMEASDADTEVVRDAAGS